MKKSWLCIFLLLFFLNVGLIGFWATKLTHRATIKESIEIEIFSAPEQSLKVDLNKVFSRRYLEIKSKENFKFQQEQGNEGPGKPLDYLKIPLYIQSSRPRNETHDITLLIQCSLSRLESIMDIARSWDGIISLAVYIQNPNVLSQLQDVLLGFFFEAESVNPLVRIDISLLFGQRFSRSPSNPLHKPLLNLEELESNNSELFEYHPYDFVYPVNTLRNLAFETASTELIFNIDSDFLPSKDMYSKLISMYDTLMMENSKKTVFVVAAFEMLGPFPRNEIPFPRESLDFYCYDLLALPFHSKFIISKKKMNMTSVKAWCEGQIEKYHISVSPIQGRTNFTRWFTAKTPYLIPFGKGLDRFFEPYLIAKKSIFPKFDESFRGYSFNKRSHITELQYAKFQFYTLPEIFLIHRSHESSNSKTILKKNKVVDETVQRTYEYFMSEIRKKYPR